MTIERRIIMSLSEIKAVVFECNSCKSRTSIVPEKLETVPKECPNGHIWQSRFGLEHNDYIFMAFITSLKQLRAPREEKTGFKVFLEFEEPSRQA